MVLACLFVKQLLALLRACSTCCVSNRRGGNLTTTFSRSRSDIHSAAYSCGVTFMYAEDFSGVEKTGVEISKFLLEAIESIGPSDEFWEDVDRILAITTPRTSRKLKRLF
ncbi:hypothetical protein Tco_0996127 [Tanacetum coccineum]